ncbi:MAG: transposase, partial [Victivallales bacterium]|nr:transposase [Victivallales bacterium]
MSNAIQEIFRTYGPAYIQQYGKQMPTNHHKVISAIRHCGTTHFGVHAFVCDDCRDVHRTGSCCGNRHGPVCQSGKSDDWLRKQIAKALPVNYFMITFTVPKELRRLIRSNQEVSYAALFKAASEAIKKLAKDPRFVGCDITGFTGILHTWTRQLEYHPHIHFIVPGGGIDRDGTEWKSSRADLFVHAKPLSKIYRAKFIESLKEAGLEVPASVWKKDWVVDARNVGNGKRALKYLAQYVFRVAISPRRIVRVADGRVTFRYQRSGEKKWKTCTLDVFEFMRRFLQHTLPHGFTKIRHYGYLSPSSRTPLQKIRELICRLYELIVNPPTELSHPPLKKKPWVCEHCGGTIHWHKFTPPKKKE